MTPAFLLFNRGVTRGRSRTPGTPAVRVTCAPDKLTVTLVIRLSIRDGF